MNAMPDPISRSQAQASGALYYFTGEPCKHGHVAPRLTWNCVCMKCKRPGVSEELLTLIACGDVADLQPRSQECARNVARVRDFLERNLGCSHKEAAYALRLDRRIVDRAVRIIREQQRASERQPIPGQQKTSGGGTMTNESLDAFERRSQASRHFRGEINRSDYWADPNYNNIVADGYDIRVFLNGRERHDWTRVDSEAGTLLTADGVVLKGEIEIKLERKPPCDITSSSETTESCSSSI